MRVWKFVARVLLSLAVSAVFVGFSLRHTNVGDVAGAIAASSGWTLAGYMGVLLAIHLVRVIRWQLLLEPLGRVSFARVNSATSIGYMLLALLPLRLGELARPVLISNPPAGGGLRIPRSGALASCVVERIVDSLAVGVLAIVSLRIMATTGRAADYARHAATIVTAGFTALCVALAFAYFARQRTVSLVEKTLGLVSEPLAARVAGILDRFIQGLHLGSSKSVLLVLGLTVFHWMLHLFGFWMMAPAFGLELTILMAATVLASQVVGSMIPAGPGMVGTTQFFIQLGLSIFIPGALSDPAVAVRAAAYANAIWLLQFLQQVVVGLPFVFAGHVSVSQIFRRWDADSGGTEPTVATLGPDAGGSIGQ